MMSLALDTSSYWKAVGTQERGSRPRTRRQTGRLICSWQHPPKVATCICVHTHVGWRDDPSGKSNAACSRLSN
eukprot:447481-Pelagomonas_calceolata.AAC.7